MNSMKMWMMTGALTLTLAACGKGDESATLAPKSVPKTAESTAINAQDASRFGFDASNPMGGGAAAAGQQAGSQLSFTAPEGWTQIASAQFRDPNFTLDGVEGGEAYVTMLPASPVDANVNRWRGQFGLADATADEIAALPKLTVMGQPATLVDITGTFGGGMSGAEAKDNWRLVGALIPLPNALITVKMTGPADALEAEVPKFKAFCESLGLAMGGAAPSAMGGAMPSSGTLPAGHPPIGAGAAGDMGGAMGAALPGAAAPSDADFTWTAPADWTSTGPKPMRLASYEVKDHPETDISLIMLAGQAGGKIANIQRWYGQMGATAPAEAELNNLPTINVLGVESPLIEIHGHYTGMGDSDVAEATMLGTIVEMPDQTLFVKFTGPSDVVKAQHQAFVNFCLSLKKK